MLIQSTFLYNDARNFINMYKYFSDHMSCLNHRRMATLPSKMWPHYPLQGITLYAQYNNEYYSLK